MIEGAVFHHIGVATNSIAETSIIYVNAGFKASETIFDPHQNVNIAFLQKENHPLIELIEPINEKSPVYNILKKVGVSAYHTCYEVENIDQCIDRLEEIDFKLLVEPVDAIALNNKKVCFLYNINVGLVELVES